jgi:hypothetical protein
MQNIPDKRVRAPPYYLQADCTDTVLSRSLLEVKWRMGEVRGHSRFGRGIETGRTSPRLRSLRSRFSSVSFFLGYVENGWASPVKESNNPPRQDSHGSQLALPDR